MVAVYEVTLKYSTDSKVVPAEVAEVSGESLVSAENEATAVHQ
jgi:hypothetical protein